MRIVAALGGSALLGRGQPPDAQEQRRRITEAAGALAPVAARHELIVTHGVDPLFALSEALQLELPDYEVVTAAASPLVERLIAPKTVVVCARGGGVAVASDSDSSWR